MTEGFEKYRFTVGLSPSLAVAQLPNRLDVAVAPRNDPHQFACPCGEAVEVTVLAYVYELSTEVVPPDPEDRFLYVLGRCPACGTILGSWGLPGHVSKVTLSAPPEKYLPRIAWRARKRMADTAKTPDQKAVAELWNREFMAAKEARP